MNKVLLIGRITKDPEIRYLQNGTPQVLFTLAVDRGMRDANGQRQADFITVIAWSKLGEFCSKYFKKGQQVGIIGRLQTRNWEDEQGQKRYVTEVIAEEAYFAEGKRDDNSITPFGNTISDSPEFEITQSDDLPF